MLQYPINVYPDKTAFDSTESDYYRGIKLTFQGDMLSALFWKLYDYDTGNLVLQNKAYGTQMTPMCYNNGDVAIPNIFANLSKGRYVLQLMMTQTRVKSMGHGETLRYDRVNVHDRYISRGKTMASYSATASIQIEDNIKVIYEWNKNGDVYSPSIIEESQDTPNFTIRAAEIVMHIGNEVVPITSYDASTGIATLANVLRYNYPSGTPYQLYANYLISDLYYFEVAQQPALMATMINEQLEEEWVEWGAYGGTFKGIYWRGDTYYLTQNGTAIKYFTYDLYKVDEDGNEWEIYKSDKIFSQNVQFDFVDDYDDMGLSGYHFMGEVETYSQLPSDANVNDVYLNLWDEKYYVKTETDWEELEDCGGNYKSRKYRIKLNFEMQNGMHGEVSEDVVSPERGTSERVPSGYYLELDNDNNWINIRLSGGHTTGAMRFRIYRVYDNASSYYNNPHKELIADTDMLEFTDYIVGNHGKYRYMIVPYDTMTGTAYQPIVTDTIANNFYGYTITALKDTSKQMYGKPLYTVGDNWKIMAEIEDTDNVQNLNRVLHVGNGKYATVTSTENNYLSGSLTAELGRMICADKFFKNDASIMAEWREFISQDCPFILRNQKGDVWLVRVTDGGSIKYGEEGRQIDSTVTFSWVECGSIYDYLIQSKDINRG